MSTAITGGEAWKPGPALLSKFSGQHVCLLGDEDSAKRLFDKNDPKVVKKILNAGRDWVQAWTEALYMHGAASVITKYGGTVEKDND